MRCARGVPASGADGAARGCGAILTPWAGAILTPGAGAILTSGVGPATYHTKTSAPGRTMELPRSGSPGSDFELVGPTAPLVSE